VLHEFRGGYTRCRRHRHEGTEMHVIAVAVALHPAQLSSPTVLRRPSYLLAVRPARAGGPPVPGKGPCAC
jgi:hypothetical protein